MAFVPLAERLDQLPWILAGPIVRRVTRESATVWLALSVANASVRLEVHVAGTQDKRTGNATVPITLGPHLHILCVTIDGPFEPGVIYVYDVEITVGTEVKRLRDAANFDFSYGDLPGPSFVLPAVARSKLRIATGSCRKPHGEGCDALALLDDRLQATHDSPSTRPQMLLLTGDQIYADDVADGLLFMIQDAVRALLRWDEELPELGPVNALLPGTRASTIKTMGFTAGIPQCSSGSLPRSHLLGFGEYLLMYLFVWSNSLWPQSLPRKDQVYSTPSVVRETVNANNERIPVADAEPPDTSKFSCQMKDIVSFRRTLTKVRRALASISTYMCFDDHDVTDDWYITSKWCADVLGHKAGRRVVGNALAAYAICQAWGNTPGRFVEPQGPEHELLNAATEFGGLSKPQSPRFDELVLPQSELFNDDELQYPARTVHWNFHVEFDAFILLGLDSRSRRCYPNGPVGFPRLISSNSLANQTARNLFPASEDKLVVAILPAPLLGFTGIEDLQAGASTEEKVLENDCEAAGLVPEFVEELLARLCARESPSANPTIVISGDVHYSFIARLHMHALHPFGQPDPFVDGKRELALLQLTASSLKNETSFFWHFFKSTEMVDTAGVIDRLPPSIGLPPAMLVFGSRDSGVLEDYIAQYKRQLAKLEADIHIIDLDFVPPQMLQNPAYHATVKAVPRGPQFLGESIYRTVQLEIPLDTPIEFPQADWWYRWNFLKNHDSKKEAVGINNLAMLGFRAEDGALEYELWSSNDSVPELVFRAYCSLTPSTW